MTIDILTTKHQALLNYLRTLSRVVVAYSGGVDSAFLLRAAADAITPANVLAVIGNSASYPTREFTEAIKLAEEV